MAKTSIEWCDHTINPIRARHRRTGARGYHCEKVSPGCQHCYASTYEPRVHLPRFEQQRSEDIEIYLDRDRLVEVLRRKAPTVYFWCDMSDIFGEWVTDKWLDEMLFVMMLTQRHTHLLLTKRVERAFKYFTHHALGGHHVLDNGKLLAEYAEWVTPLKGTPKPDWPFANVKLGTSMENQEYADKRLPTLLVTPAGGRFVSIEPQLGPVTLTWAACSCENKAEAFRAGHYSHCALHLYQGQRMLDLVITGGESGAGARPYNLQWPRSLMRQCGDLDIPLFVKQLGAFPTMTPIGTRQFEALPDNEKKIIRLKLTNRKGSDPKEWDRALRVRERMRARG